MKHTILLKRVKPSDWRTIQSIEASVPISPTFHPYTQQHDIKKYISESTVYLIYRNDHLVGSISYQIKADSSAYIDGLIVLPSFQKQGVASDSLDIILCELQTKKRIWLLTHPHNSASIIMYLKRGFVITSWTNNVFGDGQPRLQLEINKP